MQSPNPTFSIFRQYTIPEWSHYDFFQVNNFFFFFGLYLNVFAGFKPYNGLFVCLFIGNYWLSISSPICSFLESTGFL